MKLELNYRQIPGYHIVQMPCIVAQWEIGKPLHIEDISYNGADAETIRTFMRKAEALAARV